MDNLAKAKQLADEAYKDIFGLEMALRTDAQVYATIALAEQVKRLTDALEALTVAKVVAQ